MPELPEMQALAERISESLAGARFVRADPLSFSALKTYNPPPEQLGGKRLDSVGRRGKYLDLALESLRLLIHLSQAGRIDFLESGKTGGRPRGGVARLVFDREPLLLVKEFGTERKAGWWILPAGEDGPLGKLGPEPFSEEFRLLVMEGDDRARLHSFLRNQHKVAGIGRGYSDDILHRARLSPFRSLASLEGQERIRLVDAVRTVLEEALEIERKRVGGLPAKLGDHFTVHGKAGNPCPVCGGDLRRVAYESHEVAYCPNCQTGGKILADRRMSRILK